MKYLVTTLLSLFLIYVAQANHVEKNGRTFVTAKGDRITFTQPELSNVGVVNKETGEKELKSFEKIAERPSLLNGKEVIYDPKRNPELENVSVQFHKLIEDGLKSSINKLPKGCYEYIASDIVVDEAGNIAYYSKLGMKEGEQREFAHHNLVYSPISAKDRAMIEAAMRQLMSGLRAEKMIINGKPVPYLLNLKCVIAKD